MNRIAIRPLSRILPARLRGEDPDRIEKENLNIRHEQMRDSERVRSNIRLLLIIVMFICIYTAIGARLATLASSHPTEPVAQSNGSALFAQRADIVDRKGRILATNLETHALYVETRHLVDPLNTARKLADLFVDLNADDLYAQFTSSRKFLWIKKKLSPEQMQAVHDIGEPGLRFGPRETRLYPNGALASHILGGASFGKEGVKSAEIIGVAGVEKQFDSQLRDPSYLKKPLKLTIDLSIQAAVEHVLEGGMRLLNAKGAVAILMEVDTGRIISLASLPDFDPNHRPKLPVRGSAAESPLFNKAIQGVYDLGSTFKIFTVAQALELGLVDPKTKINTKGPIRMGGHKINDYRNNGPELPVWQVITKSSNLGTARIAKMIGSEKQKEFLSSLGFTKPTSIEMVEASGGKPLLPKRWNELETMTVSYGHGISVTPLHLATGYAMLANGGRLVKPTLLEEVKSGLSPRVISKEVADHSLAMLRGVVTSGTASIADVSGYFVGGKTGTADKPSAQGGYDKEKNITSFASIFPINEPKYVLVVALDEAQDTSGPEPKRTAGWTAVPVSAEIIARVAPLLGLRPKFDSQSTLSVTLSNWQE
jgi:cell division protein FtsI (penicillin-binding protein 3)